MKGKVGVKTIVIMVILVLVMVLGVLGVKTVRTYLGSAAGEVEPANVAAAAADDGRSATVSWVSEKESMAVVEYGTTPASLLLRAVETNSVTSHKVALSPLKANVSYYYRIRIGDEVFDNGGIPYSFKTTAAVTVTPTAVVTVIPTAAVSSCNRTMDYNGDGVVNSLDYIDCLQGDGVDGVTAVPTAADDCTGVDFDNNGVINSLDKVKCLQDR